MAKLYDERCTELCYMLHTAPQTGEIASTENWQFNGFGENANCRIEVKDASTCNVAYDEVLCSQHATADLMTRITLSDNGDKAEALKVNGLVWRTELRNEAEALKNDLP